MNRFSLLISLFLSCHCAAATAKAWPPAEKSAAIAGCRLSIIESAERDYVKRHKLKEPPANFREKTAGAMEPFLATCDCFFDELEKQWSYDFFMSNQDKVPSKMQELGAACVPNGAQQGVPADGSRPAGEPRR
jgi:hypothetical protein